MILVILLALAQWQEYHTDVFSYVDSDACVAYLERPPSDIVFVQGKPTFIELKALGCPLLSIQWEITCPHFVRPDQWNGIIPVGASTWVSLRAQAYVSDAKFGVGFDEDEMPAVSETMAGQVVWKYRTCPRGDKDRDCFVGAHDLVILISEYKQANPQTPWRLILDDMVHLQNGWQDRWIGRGIDPITILVGPSP